MATSVPVTHRKVGETLLPPSSISWEGNVCRQLQSQPSDRRTGLKPTPEGAGDGESRITRATFLTGEKGQSFPKRGRFGSDLRDFSALGALGFLNKAERGGTRCDNTFNYRRGRVIKSERDTSFGGTRSPDLEREAARGALIHLQKSNGFSTLMGRRNKTPSSPFQPSWREEQLLLSKGKFGYNSGNGAPGHQGSSKTARFSLASPNKLPSCGLFNQTWGLFSQTAPTFVLLLLTRVHGKDKKLCRVSGWAPHPNTTPPAPKGAFREFGRRDAADGTNLRHPRRSRSP